MCEAPVFYGPAQGVTLAAPIGPFNDWGRGPAQPLEDRDGDGVLEGLVDLGGPGLRSYRIWVDGLAARDPYNPLTVFGEDGREHSAAWVGDCARPTLEVEDFHATADGHVEATLAFWRAPGGAGVDPESVSATLDGAPVATTVDAAQGRVQVRAHRLAPGKHRLRVSAHDLDGVEVEAPLLLPFWVEATPFEWRDALIYQVFVDRFRRGGGAPLASDAPISFHHGGDLWGVIEALEAGYFEAMGVNALWISPMYRNPDGVFIGRDGHQAEPYHGYWPAAAREVSERFGGAAALEALVAAAHARGVRVIMDAVLNHVHVEHPYYKEHHDAGWFNHPDGACICGVSCPWGEHMQTCWFDPFLADLRWREQGVVEQLTDDALWWIERFNLDGLRLDAVPMMPRLAIRHLRARARERFEQRAAPLYLVGETYTQRGDQPLLRHFLGPHTLDGQFDFPIMWALRDALAQRTPLSSLEAEIATSEAAWEGSGAVMGMILGNHDVPRFISDVNGDRVWEPRAHPPPTPSTPHPYELLRLGWTVLLSLPGAPVIYYGDELGLPGGYDPDNRRDMRFEPHLSEDERAVKAHVERLGRARRCTPALRRGARRPLLVNTDLYAFGRDAADGYPSLTLINRSDQTQTTSLTLPPDWTLAADASPFDALGNALTHDGAQVHITLPPRSSALILSDPRCRE